MTTKAIIVHNVAWFRANQCTFNSTIKLIHDETDSRWPVWLPDGKAFLYVGESGGALTLMRYDLADGTRTPLTTYTDDSVVAPAVSADGSTRASG